MRILKLFTALVLTPVYALLSLLMIHSYGDQSKPLWFQKAWDSNNVLVLMAACVVAPFYFLMYWFLNLTFDWWQDLTDV